MPGSRINPLRDTFTMLRDVLLIRWNSLQGRYRIPSPLPDQVAASGRQRAKAAARKR